VATPRASRRAPAALALTAQLLAFQPLAAAASRAEAPQVVNVSARGGNQSEAAVAVDPSDPANVVVVSNTTLGALFVGVSHDGGATWARRLIATGHALGAACCDPSMSWDEQGNLFLAWLDERRFDVIPVAISTDAGDSFQLLTVLHPPAPQRAATTAPRATRELGGEDDEGHGGLVDQPTIVSGLGMVWLVWDHGSIQAAGARVFGLGDVGRFRHVQDVPGTRRCSFGDIQIGPEGQVVQVCTRDRSAGGNDVVAVIRVNVDPDGLGPAGFGPASSPGTTNVRQFEPIAPQLDRTVDAETGLVWDRSGGAFAGRLYLVYTDEQPNDSDRTDIWVRSSDDDGQTWSAPVRVNDDRMNRRSQFLPRIAIDPATGALAVGFHDARRDDGLGGVGDTDGIANDDAMYFLAFSTDGGASFARNIQVAAGASNAQDAHNEIDYGDYTGLAFAAGIAHPVWADNSDSTADNPDGSLSAFDIYTASVPLG
jgi:hypothetical protein